MIPSPAVPEQLCVLVSLCATSLAPGSPIVVFQLHLTHTHTHVIGQLLPLTHTLTHPYTHTGETGPIETIFLLARAANSAIDHHTALSPESQ